LTEGKEELEGGFLEDLVGIVWYVFGYAAQCFFLKVLIDTGVLT